MPCQTMKSYFRGLKILKDDFDSLRRGEGVPVDQTPMEEQEP